MIKKFFLKRFKNYLLIFMVPSLIMLAFVFGMLSTSKTSETRSTSLRSLENINEMFRLITDNAFYQQDMMTLNPQMVVSLRKILLFSTTNYTDYVFLNSMKTLLSTISQSSPYIRSLYLYLESYDSFFSSDRSICSLQTYYDTSWYPIYKNLPSSQSSTIIPRTVPASSNQEEYEALTFYQRLSYIKGCMIANIPVNTFLSSMQSILPVWDNRLFVVNAQSDILLSTEAVGPRLEKYRQWLSESFDSSRHSDGAFIFMNGSPCMINSLHNDEYDLDFILIVPLSAILQNILQDILWPVLLVAFNILLILLLSYITTRNNFRQISYVIQIFGDAEKGIYPKTDPDKQPPSNEYDLIMNNVLHMFLNTTFLHSQLEEQKYKKKAAELAALQLQINPHFMINTLQTLDFEVYKLTGKPTDVHLIINYLSDILQYSLGHPDQPVTIGDEIANVRKYVEIQKYRFPDSFLVYFDVEEEALGIPFRRLILQPLVENSISHGIRATDHYGYIKIRIFLRGEWVYVSVIDNGAGIPKEKLLLLCQSLSSENAGSGIGLDNVNKRLVLTYGPDSALRILSHAGMATAVSFRIPRNSQKSTTEI